MFYFFVLLLLLFGIAALLGLDWIYYLLYVVGGVWAISHWWVRRSLSNVVFSRQMDEKAFAGEDIQVTLMLRNRSRLPIPWLRIQESVPSQLSAGEPYRTVVRVGGRRQTDYEYTLHCHRRGYYVLGPLRLYTGDLFGFVEHSWRENRGVHVTVYPKVLSLPELGLSSQLPFGTVRSQQRIFEDPTRIAGVRPYDAGDSMRHIHWRASAHEDELLVKKYQPAIALDTTVVLDLDQTAYPVRQRYGTTEWAITVAASLTNHLARRRQAVGFLSNGWDPLAENEVQAVSSQTGQAQLMSILELMARVELRESEHEETPSTQNGASEEESVHSLPRWLNQRALSLGWGSTIIVVTASLTDPLIWMLHSLFRRGLSVIVVTCVPSTDFDSQKGRAESLGIQAYQTVWEADFAKLQSNEQQIRH